MVVRSRNYVITVHVIKPSYLAKMAVKFGRLKARFIFLDVRLLIEGQ